MQAARVWPSPSVCQTQRAARTALQRVFRRHRDELSTGISFSQDTAYGEMAPFCRRGHSSHEIRWKASVVGVVRKHLSSTTTNV